MLPWHSANNRKVKVNRIELHAANEVVIPVCDLGKWEFVVLPYLALTLEFPLPCDLVLFRRQGLGPRYIYSYLRPWEWDSPHCTHTRVINFLFMSISFRLVLCLCGFFAQGSKVSLPQWNPVSRFGYLFLCAGCTVENNVVLASLNQLTETDHKQTN